jgi:hypothetical protein
MPTRQVSLAAEPARRNAPIRGIAIDFDRDAERCFFSVDFEGRDSDLVWSIPRDHETHKRFHPLDISQRVGALAVAPDGRTLAVRFGAPGSLTPPALYDPETEQTALIVADEQARREWLAALVNTAEALLVSGLPPAEVDGQTAARPTVLPLPGELAALDNLPSRLARIARLGNSLGVHRSGGTGDEISRTNDPSEIEARLFFSYLQGDLQRAAAELDALEPNVSDLEHRLRLLSLRAQILWSAGRHSDARSITAYLLAEVGSDTRRIEETPYGVVVTHEVSPVQAWARYLVSKTAEEPRAAGQAVENQPGVLAEPKPLNPFDAHDFRGFEPGGEAFPFAPAFRGLVEDLPAGKNGRAAEPKAPVRAPR